MPDVLGISGSLRKASYNTALVRACQSLAPPDMNIEFCDISGLPMYNADVHEAGLPPAVAAFIDALRAADGLVIACPEYNRSVPAVLKNAIDWASKTPPQPFDGMPIAIMGASRGILGTIMANHHLRQIFVYLNGRAVNGPEVLVGKAAEKFDDQGVLTDEPTRQFVAGHLARLDAVIAECRANDA